MLIIISIVALCMSDTIRLHSVGVFARSQYEHFDRTDYDGSDLEIITKYVDTSEISFFKRGMYVEACTATMRYVVANHCKGYGTSDTYEFDYEGESHQATIVNAKINGDVYVVICAAPLYPRRTRLNLGRELLDVASTERTLEEMQNKMQETIERYTDLKSVDKISAIQSDLDETYDTMKENIEKVITNNEQIDELVERSADLSESSKTFYRQARKLNSSCCILI